MSEPTQGRMTIAMAKGNLGPATIIGIDCSAEAKSLGLALTHLEAGGLRVDELELESSVLARFRKAGDPVSLGDILRQWVSERAPVLISIDAPLGWPAPLVAALADHQAGDVLFAQPPTDDPFRRLTDRLVHRRLGLTPLSVGADRIARTAKRALELVAPLGLLAWSPRLEKGAGVIEVYPAATLKALELPCKGYKEADANERSRILAGLRAAGLAISSELEEKAVADDDLLDAVVAAFAGYDFLQGLAVAPDARQFRLARQEGWIWVRSASAR